MQAQQIAIKSPCPIRVTSGNKCNEWMSLKLEIVRHALIIVQLISCRNERSGQNSYVLRHPVTREYDPPSGVSISTLRYGYSTGYAVTEYAHGADQLLYAASGVMQISPGKIILSEFLRYIHTGPFIAMLRGIFGVTPRAWT
jgi:hypothetical protein